MSKLDRDDIQIISKHSNWSEKSVAKALKSQIYNDKPFLGTVCFCFLVGARDFVCCFGCCFLFCLQLGKTEQICKTGYRRGIASYRDVWCFVHCQKKQHQKLLLTAAAMLVGVLYAIFGQVYQTGANAYDFFLGWTLFVTLWAIVANFSPLWVIYIALVNTSIILYGEQVADNWTEMLGFTTLFAVNVCFLSGFLWLRKAFSSNTYPSWFTNLLALTAITYSTIGIVMGIGENRVDSFFGVLLLVSLVVYGIGIWYGFAAKRSFYLAVIPFSVIIIVCAALLDVSDDAGMFFVIGFFIVVSITLLIYFLNKIQKRWGS